MIRKGVSWIELTQFKEAFYLKIIKSLTIEITMKIQIKTSVKAGLYNRLPQTSRAVQLVDLVLGDGFEREIPRFGISDQFPNS